MERKAVSGIMLTLLLASMLTLAFNIQPAKAEPTTWTVDDDGPADFSKIQDAINAASSGDTVFVHNGTYRENVVVTKTVSLLGENRNTTIIDGVGIVLRIEASNVIFDGFTVQNGELGIYLISTYPLDNRYRGEKSLIKNIAAKNNSLGIYLLGSTQDNKIIDNIIENNTMGVLISGSGNNSIINNVVANNIFGLALESTNNVLRDNRLLENKYNLLGGLQHDLMGGEALTSSPGPNDIDISNTVNEKPIYFLVNQRNQVIDNLTSPVPGYIGLINSSNIAIKNLNLANNGEGILLSQSKNITIEGCTLKNNMDAITAYYLNNTVIRNNEISNNLHGIKIIRGRFNEIASNTIRNNTFNVPLFLNNPWLIRYPDWIRWWVTGEIIYYSSGIYLLLAYNNTLISNTITNNERGIFLGSSNFNTLRHNTMIDNVYNFGVRDFGIGLIPDSNFAWAINDIDISNRVNGKPIYYWIGQQNKQVPTDAGYVALVNSTNIIVKDLVISNNTQGILLVASNKTTILNNAISSAMYGVEIRGYVERLYWPFRFHHSFNNTVSKNNFENNGFGVYMSGANSTVSENTLSHNLAAIMERSSARAGFNLIAQNTIFNNTMPPWTEWIFGWLQPRHMALEFWVCDAFGAGVVLGGSRNIVSGNIIKYNDYGLSFFREISPTQNKVLRNSFINNSIGIEITTSDNEFYHNNFVSNTKHVSWERFANKIIPPVNVWDAGYPSGGNYWSDYAAQDANYDGIGDSPYVIDANNTDRYPLMGPFSTFVAGTWNEITYNVDVASNSTISDLTFNLDQKTISFNVTGSEGTLGFCRATVPNDLLGGPYVILINDSPPLTLNEMSNGTHTFLYFTYNHSTQSVNIVGTTAVPEFPTPTILLLLMALTMLSIIFLKKGKRKT